jgi:predicted AAA+ superfamily ATPase
MASHVTRYIEQPVKEDVKRKMVFIGRPRQSGKTTLAKGDLVVAASGARLP